MGFDWTEVRDQFPTPFIEDLRNGRLLPIIGSGFSMNAKVPDGRPPLDWKGLASVLGSSLGGPSEQDDSALETISRYEMELGRPRLVQAVASAIRWGEAEPGAAHHRLVELNFLEYVTTNFDELLEQALRLRLGGVVRVVVEESQLALARPSTVPRVIKLHGDVQHPTRMVLSEADYDSFLHKNPLLASYLASLLVDRVGLLLGYSLDDPDFRQVLAMLRDRMGASAPPLWTIRFNDTPASLARFRRRGVTPINLVGDFAYGDGLAPLFENLAQLQSQAVGERAQGNTDDLQEVLRASDRRLVFFSVPRQRLAWYDEYIFPVVREYGLVPVSATDVTSESNPLNQIDYLLRLSVGALVELGFEEGQVEYGAIRARLGPSEVRLAQSFQQPGPDLGQLADDLVDLTFLALDEPELFRRNVARWCEELASTARLAEIQRVEQLREQGFLNEAYLTAYITLEGLLNERIRHSGDQTGSGERLRTFTSINDFLTSSGHGLIEPEVEWRKCRNIRNQLVHGMDSPPPEQVEHALEIVLRLISAVR
jgi:hypothetical protein